MIENVTLSLSMLFTLFTITLACLATVPTIPTTTTSPVVTTTSVVTTTDAEVTTTEAKPACATCTMDTITFIPADGNEGSIDAEFRVEEPDANGCLRLTAICSAQNGFFSFMQFNINQGGPPENAAMTEVVEAELQCIDGLWYFNRERVVRSVDCTEAPLGGG